MTSNHREYSEFLSGKYQKSNKIYKTKIDKNDPYHYFLSYYDRLNIYPTYPKPMILNIKNYRTKNNDDDVVGYKFSDNLFKIATFLKNVVDDKIEEYRGYEKLIKKNINKEKIRRFFDYEIRDAINEYFPNTKITNGYTKMYEIMGTYNFFGNVASDKLETINTFHICEHPGKFIFAVRDFIKANDKYKNAEHKFIFQSLDPSKYKKAFRISPDLSNYRENLDYGPNYGDITDIENIKYYRKKYLKNNFKLITADCGLDFKEDFTKQECGSYKIILGSLICAIAVSNPGSNFVFKIFSFYSLEMTELLNIACMFYEKVYISRLMTTKGSSGENYCVCQNFNYSDNVDNMLDKLYNYLNKNKNKNKYFLKTLNKQTTDKIVNHAKLITMRRIMSYNMAIFRIINFEYVNNNKRVIEYNNYFIQYYVNYFFGYVGLKKSKMREKEYEGYYGADTRDNYDTSGRPKDNLVNYDPDQNIPESISKFLKTLNNNFNKLQLDYDIFDYDQYLKIFKKNVIFELEEFKGDPKENKPIKQIDYIREFEELYNTRKIIIRMIYSYNYVISHFNKIFLSRTMTKHSGGTEIALTSDSSKFYNYGNMSEKKWEYLNAFPKKIQKNCDLWLLLTIKEIILYQENIFNMVKYICKKIPEGGNLYIFSHFFVQEPGIYSIYEYLFKNFESVKMEYPVNYFYNGLSIHTMASKKLRTSISRNIDNSKIQKIFDKINRIEYYGIFLVINLGVINSKYPNLYHILEDKLAGELQK